MRKLVAFLLLLLSGLALPINSSGDTELPENPGTYPVRTSYLEHGKKLQKKVYVTVKGPNTVIVGDIAIDANDFFLTVEQAKVLTTKQAIEYSQATAWSTIDGTEKVIGSVDLSNLSANEGSYNVTFSTKEGISKKVKAAVAAPLLGNHELNSYQDYFSKSYWRFLLTIGLSLALVLATPLLIVLISSKNILQVVEQLIAIFSR